MSNQLSGKPVNVDAFEVVELLSLEIEDSRTKDDRYMDARLLNIFPSTAGLRCVGPTLGAPISCASRSPLASGDRENQYFRSYPLTAPLGKILM